MSSQNGRPKVFWLTKEGNTVANALGYGTHNKYMRKYCQDTLDFDDTSPLALQIVSADWFTPVPDRVNVLFTMWEFMNMPPTYLGAMEKAEYLIVPSSFCRDLFRRFVDKPVYVCHEGIEPEKFPYYDRRGKDVIERGKFRFLWVGAPNPRKGYPFILEVIKLFEHSPEVEIYIKTTAPKKLNLKEFLKVNGKRIKDIIFGSKDRWGYPVSRKTLFHQINMSVRNFFREPLAGRIQHMGKYKNVIFDTRKLPDDELLALYNSASCFILPTLGEGWGLTLTEAMATGCPCIATPVTGCADFFDEEVGYPLKYEIKEIDLDNYHIKSDAYVPVTQDLVDKMLYVVSHYQEALRKGRKASERIHSKFTWQQSANRMADIIKEIERSEYARG